MNCEVTVTVKLTVALGNPVSEVTMTERGNIGGNPRFMPEEFAPIMGRAVQRATIGAMKDQGAGK
ncbi:MAG: hypothetical protein AB7T06_40800 [Kofleriaceae bacterium]